MTQDKQRCYVAKPYVEVSGKNRGWQNKRCSVRGIGEEQLEFRQGRGTTDGMFALRQLVENKLEGQEDMAIRFIDLWPGA